MKVFVVSLVGSKRRSFIAEQLNKFNIDFEFFDAVDGKRLSQEEKVRYCSMDAIKAHPTWLNDGAIGCALSHYFLYKKIKDQNIEKAIIMEDDMVLNQSFYDIYRYLAKGDIQSEVLMLYYRAFRTVSFSTFNSAEIIGGFKILHPRTLNDIPITTGCYYITNEACVKLEKAILPIRVGADSWKYFIQNSELSDVRVVYPRPIDDAGLKSEINYLDDRILLKTIVRYTRAFSLPLEPLKRWKRKRLERKMSKFKLVSEPSDMFFREA